MYKRQISGSEPRGYKSCGHEAVEPVEPIEAVEPEDTTPTDVFESDPEETITDPIENKTDKQ